MEVPSIDIDALPLLDTAVGLFGSFATDATTSKPGTYETTVVIILIVHD